MTTISELRQRLRVDLHDPDGELWPDAVLDRHIERALHELSLSLPDERVAIVATTPNSRDVSLAGIPGLIGVEAVAYPSGATPPHFVPFRRWGETLTILGDLVPDGSNATLWVRAAHTIDASGTTLPEHFVDVLAAGAAAYAALERALSRTRNAEPRERSSKAVRRMGAGLAHGIPAAAARAWPARQGACTTAQPRLNVSSRRGTRYAPG